MCGYIVQMDVEYMMSPHPCLCSLITFNVMIYFQSAFMSWFYCDVCGFLYFARWHGFMSCPNATDFLPNAMEFAHVCTSGSATIFPICAWSRVT